MSRKKINLRNFTYVLLFGAILLVASFFRLYGVNWDQGQHLDPDERFMTMVANSMQWPDSIFHYFNTSESKLNPHNVGYDFYVYGTWPLIFVKLISGFFFRDDYVNLTLIGRTLSAVVDMLTLVTTFFIGKRLTSFFIPLEKRNERKDTGMIVGLLSMAAYATMALPIQLSHFFTTDPYVTLFLTTSILILLYPPTIFAGILLGLSTGLALSAKISGMLIFPVVGLSSLLFLGPSVLHFIRSTYSKDNDKKKAASKDMNTKIIQLIIFYILFTAFFYLSFRTLMPYLFSDSRFITVSLNPKVLTNWKTLVGFLNPDAWFPPAVQWIHTQKIIYPFFSILFVGLGLPWGMLLLLSLGVPGFHVVKIARTNRYIFIILAWIILLFVYQGIQFAIPVRYFWAIYPMFAVIISLAISYFFETYKDRIARIPVLLTYGTVTIITVLLLAWPLAVFSIYTRPNSRVTASYWIYTMIPQGSTIASEHWDDPLPLNVPPYNSSVYKGIQLQIFGMEGTEKWNAIANELIASDYLILSSNRAYGSLSSVPERFPQTKQYYEELFSGRLGFEKVAEFASRPNLAIPFVNVCIPIPYFSYGKIDQLSKETIPPCKGMMFIDDYTDETWTVYDHPKVTIFKKVQPLTHSELIQRITKENT